MSWGSIAIACRVGQGAHPLFFQSWTSLLVGGLCHGDKVLEPTAGCAHHYAAEALASQFLAYTECDTLMFIDDDMVFPVDAVERLRSNVDGESYGIVQALCVSSQPPHDPQVGDPRPPVNELVEVEHCGLAFTMIRRKVLREVIAAKPKQDMCFAWGVDGMAEDVRFCRQATALGHRCGQDTNTQVGHVLGLVATWDHLRQRPRFGSRTYQGRPKMIEMEVGNG